MALQEGYWLWASTAIRANAGVAGRHPGARGETSGNGCLQMNGGGGTQG